MTTPTKRFIEDAIKGGWRKEERPDLDVNNDGYSVRFLAGDDTSTLWEADILLDPLAWQAVGKTRGWQKELITYKLKAHTFRPFTKQEGVKRKASMVTRLRYRKNSKVFQVKMHRFIDHLADGRTIDEALSLIE